MTEFTTLRQAIDYQSHCPLCHHQMVIDGRYGIDVRKDYTWDFREKTILTWLRSNEEVTIDVDTEVIKATIKQATTTVPVFGANFSASAANYTHTPIKNGLLYLRLGMGCEECCQYSYLVQILIDMSHPKIVSLPLNSETISMEDDKRTVHEIKNIYTTNETQYSYFRSDQPAEDMAYGGAPLVFPLIPLDLVNPQKTLNRIRNLIVFS